VDPGGELDPAHRGHLEVGQEDLGTDHPVGDEAECLAAVGSQDGLDPEAPERLGDPRSDQRLIVDDVLRCRAAWYDWAGRRLG